VSCVKHYVRP